MTRQQATELATELLNTNGERGFEISMPDRTDYDQMRQVFADLGRPSHEDGGAYFIIAVPARPAEPARSRR